MAICRCILQSCHPGLGIRGKNRIRHSIFFDQFVPFNNPMILVQVKRNSFLTQPISNRMISFPGIGFDIPVGMHCSKGPSIGQKSENIQRTTVENQQVAPKLKYLLLQIHQSVIQEGYPCIILVLQLVQNIAVKDEYPHYCPIVFQGMVQSCIVMEA